MKAGARKAAVTAYLRSPNQGSGGAPSSSAGGSAPMVASVNFLLERLRRGRLESRRGAVDVLVLEEVLKDLPLALSRRGAERRRLEVGQVEPRGLGCDQRGRRAPRERVAVRAQRDLLVRRSEPAPLRPDRGRRG